MASAIDKRAKLKDNRDLLTLYHNTREYRSLIAEKAARTRKQKANKK